MRASPEEQPTEQRAGVARTDAVPANQAATPVRTRDESTTFSPDTSVFHFPQALGVHGLEAVHAQDENGRYIDIKSVQLCTDGKPFNNRLARVPINSDKAKIQAFRFTDVEGRLISVYVEQGIDRVSVQVKTGWFFNLLNPDAAVNVNYSIRNSGAQDGYIQEFSNKALDGGRPAVRTISAAY